MVLIYQRGEAAGDLTGRAGGYLIEVGQSKPDVTYG
jgi:hypothetical protein